MVVKYHNGFWVGNRYGLPESAGRGYCRPMGKTRKKNFDPEFNAGLGMRPRHYAARIIAKKDRLLRKEMLDEVPAEYRSWVEESVRDYFWKKKYQKP